MNTSERRKFKRVGAKFGICCNEVSSTSKQHYVGRTVNVSPGGLCFQTDADIFKPGNLSKGSLLKVELSIPPTKGLLEFGGRISGFVRVLRTSNLYSPTPADRYGVALEFCQSPKLSV